MKAVILFTGENYTENAKSENAAFLVREITTLGYEVDVHPLNLDDQKGFSRSVASAIEEYNLIFFIGGMGEGFSKNAKEIVCGGLGLSLVAHQPSLNKLEQLCKKNGRDIDEKDIKFITVPSFAKVFTDVHYAIPGFAVESAGQSIIMLPDNDDIYISMYINHVFDYICERIGVMPDREVIRVFGLSGEQLRKNISDLLLATDPILSIFTRGYGAEYVHMFSVENDAKSTEYMSKLILLVKKRLGNLITDVDVNALPSKVVELLEKNEFKVSIAESITDGLLARYLKKIENSGDVIGFTANSLLHNVKQEEMNVSVDVIKKYPDASEEMAVAMAAGILNRGNADIALSISGGMAPDSRGGYNSAAFVSLATEQGVMVEKINLHNMSISKNQVLGILAICCLNMVYKFINGLPATTRNLIKLRSLSLTDIEETSNEIRLREKMLLTFPEEVRQKPNDGFAEESSNEDLDILDSTEEYFDNFVNEEIYSPFYGEESYVENEYEEYDSPENHVYYDDPHTKDGAVPMYDSDDEAGVYTGGMTDISKPDYFSGNEPVQDKIQNFSDDFVHDKGDTRTHDVNSYRDKVSVGTKESVSSVPEESVPKEKPGKLSKMFPNRQDSSSEKVFKIIIWVLILAIMLALGILAGLGFQSSKDNPYDSLVKIYDKTNENTKPSADYPEEYKAKFYGLYKINPHVRAMMDVPGSESKVPVVQAEENNLFYLTHDFYDEKNDYGTPFIDYRTEFDSSKNTIMYVGNKDNSEIYTQLIQYDNLEFYQKNPVIKMDTVHGEREYIVFAAYIVTANISHSDVYDGSLLYSIDSEEKFEHFISDTKSRSILDVFVDTQYSDDMIMLAADMDDFDGARFIVVGRKMRENERPVEAVKSVSLNPSPIYPEKWRELYGIIDDPSETKTIVDNVGNSETTQKSDMSKTQDGDEISENDNLSSLSEQDQYKIPEVVKSMLRTASESKQNSPEEPTKSDVNEVPTETSQPQNDIPKEAPPAPPDEDIGQEENNSSSESSSSASSEEAQSSENQSAQHSEPPSPESPSQSLPSTSSESSSQNQQSSSQSSSQSPQNPSDSSSQPSGSSNNVKHTMKIASSGGVIEKDAYDVVSMVVAAEMGESFHPEALKAQTVAAYTFILFENSMGKAPYLPTATPGNKVKAAVSEVLGQKVMYGGNPAFTTYFATSAGKTNSSKEVWGGHYDYLVSVDSKIDELANKFTAEKTFSESDVKKLVKQKLGIDLSGAPNSWFKVVDYTSGGYNGTVEVGGYTISPMGNKTITGRILRENVFGLRSAAFTITYSGGMFTFTTKGYGHGVGMSQTGAHGLANNGYNYKQILAHYYPGTSLS